jgi:hypothetical protein
MKRVLCSLILIAILMGCAGKDMPLTKIDPPKEAKRREFQGAYIVDCGIEGFKSPALRENP